MKVKLSQENAPVSFGSHNLLSFEGSLALIHVKPNDADELRKIQMAARRLASLGVPVADLIESWQDFQALAFAHGFCSAKKPNAVTFAGASSQWQAQWKHASWLKAQVNGTPEDVFPEALALSAGDWIKAVAAPGTCQSQILRGTELRDAGYVGIYGVGRGSSRPPVFLSLDYNPTGNPNTPVSVALVGKGITFDSGGYSIKETTSMLGMKCDMGGAASVSAALALAIELGLNQRVKLFLCCAENLISGHAYKLGDILRYRNGTAVEVVNTDAEGRLVLADGLIDASASGASMIIDAATLTGAAITALGTDYNAVFGNQSTAVQNYLRIAETQHELHWQLPLAPFHQSKCPSPYADTANSRPVKGGGPGGASNAAGFLQRFVPPDAAWLHLDLAGAFADNDGPLYSAGATALGLRTLAQQLLQS